MSSWIKPGVSKFRHSLQLPPQSIPVSSPSFKPSKQLGMKRQGSSSLGRLLLFLQLFTSVQVRYCFPFNKHSPHDVQDQDSTQSSVWGGLHTTVMYSSSLQPFSSTQRFVFTPVGEQAV